MEAVVLLAVVIENIGVVIMSECVKQTFDTTQ